MGRWRNRQFGAAIACLVAATPAAAVTPRELLVQAAFGDSSKEVALQRVDRARSVATSALARSPGDEEAAIISATALSYRAKLTGNRTDAVAARKQFEALTVRFPRNPEAQVALGAWHVGIIASFGRLIARAAVGAQKAVGLGALDKAVAMGGNRAMFTGLAGLLRLELDPSDPQGRALTEAASRGTTPTPVDRAMQRAATAVLVPLHAGDMAATRAMASQSLPLGRLTG